MKYGDAVIGTEWQERLHQYITGIFQEHKHKVLQINSMPNHIHIFIGMRPNQSISSLIQNVKTESSKWINAQKLSRGSFAWQEGYMVLFLIPKAMLTLMSNTFKIRKYIARN